VNNSGYVELSRFAVFVRNLYADSGLESPWSPENYANWIEHEPLQRFSGLALETLEIVGFDETPNYDEWIGGGFGGRIQP
jgi:hypothetical protein